MCIIVIIIFQKLKLIKKLLFVLAFAFIGQQAFSQVYLITISDASDINSCSTFNNETTLSKITPAKNTHLYRRRISQGALIAVNSEINSIISQGYKLIETNYSQYNSYGGGLQRNGVLKTFIFAIP